MVDTQSRTVSSTMANTVSSIVASMTNIINVFMNLYEEKPAKFIGIDFKRWQ